MKPRRKSSASKKKNHLKSSPNKTGTPPSEQNQLDSKKQKRSIVRTLSIRNTPSGKKLNRSNSTTDEPTEFDSVPRGSQAEILPVGMFHTSDGKLRNGTKSNPEDATRSGPTKVGRSKSVKIFQGLMNTTNHRATVNSNRKSVQKSKGVQMMIREHVSGPFNIKRTVHVMLDSDKGLIGLPAEVEAIFKSSGISFEDVKAQPDVVAKVITFHQKEIKKETINDEEEKSTGSVELPADRKFTFEEFIER
jgi:hypothetical protein